MVIRCVTHCVKGVNQLPAYNGMLEDQSPSTLAIGAQRPSYFGEYILAHTVRK